MYPPLYACSARDPDEERKIRKLAGARHAPADWILRSRMIVLSWAGKHVTAIAAEPGCHPKTVRERLHRFNTEGIDGLGDRPIPGRPRRLTEDDRSMIALARSDPPGLLVRGPDRALDAAEGVVKLSWWPWGWDDLQVC
jgi:Winged helix-turn helix